MALFIDLTQGDKIDIDGGRIVVTVQDKSGQRVRLKIDADKRIPITRQLSETKK